MMTKDYFHRSAVMLIAERHFMQAIIQADQALAMADYYDCMDVTEEVGVGTPESIKSFYQSMADCHIRTAKAIVQHLYNDDELSYDDARAINHRLVWFNYPEVEADA